MMTIITLLESFSWCTILSPVVRVYAFAMLELFGKHVLPKALSETRFHCGSDDARSFTR